ELTRAVEVESGLDFGDAAEAQIVGQGGDDQVGADDDDAGGAQLNGRHVRGLAVDRDFHGLAPGLVVAEQDVNQDVCAATGYRYGGQIDGEVANGRLDF